MEKNYFSKNDSCVIFSNAFSQTNHLLPSKVKYAVQRSLLFLALCLFAAPVFSQVTIGTSATTQIYPLGNVLGYERSASIYLSSEVGSGTINQLAWYATNSVAPRPIVIYLKTTSASTLTSSTWASQTAGATLVYSGILTPSPGWNTITLDTPFVYNAASGNLAVLVEANAGGTGLGQSGNSGVRYSNANFRHMFYRANNAAPLTPGTVNAARPNIQISFASSAVAPDCAVAQLPANGATVARNTILSWQAGNGQPTSYDIYFGTNPNPPFVGNQATTTYSLGVLQANTQYYWKVVPRNAVGATPGCATNTFTTNDTVTYCNSAPISNDNLGITNITLGPTSFAHPDVTYSNFDTAVTISRASTANLQITFQTGITYDTNVWIDYNNDGHFSNTNELLFQGNSAAANTAILDASFFIDETVALGTYKMRIGTADIGQAIPNPCYTGAFGVTVDMMINITEAIAITPDCPTSYLPASGSLAVVVNPMLTWQAATGNPSSYDIYFGTDPNPQFQLNVPSSTTSFSPTAPLQPSQIYYWKIVAKNSFGESNNCDVQSFMTSDQLQYCVPTYTNPCASGDVVQDFSLNTISNIGSGCNPNANNYMNYPEAQFTTSLGQGITYNATVKVGSQPANVAVFIDFNRNGTFETNERFATTSLVPANGIRIIPIAIPPSAAEGKYRMRVRSVGGFSFAQVDDCNAATYGEVEDYTISIIECNSAIWYADADNDGYGNSDIFIVNCEQPQGYTLIGGDCDDTDSSVFQSAILYIDQDGDGFDAGTALVCYGQLLPQGYTTTTLGQDCDDTVVLYADADGDGYGSTQISGCGVANATDCDDADPSIFRNVEVYIDADNDGYHSDSIVMCIGEELNSGYSFTTLGEDCDDSQLLYADADGDGFGTGEPVGCGVANNTDCDDFDAAVYQTQTLYIDQDNDGFHGSAVAVCFGGLIPEGFSLTTLGQDCDDNLILYADVDGDGYGAGEPAACGVPNSDDCNDNDALVYQSITLFVDADGDGYDNGTAVICSGQETPHGYSLTTLGNDCDDQNPAIYRHQIVYIDADGDGYDNGMEVLCIGQGIPVGYTLETLGTDCNDQDADVFHGAILFADADGDGYYGASDFFCYGNTLPEGFSETTLGMDCNDNDAAFNSGAEEILYNGIDENCNGHLDEGFELTTTVKSEQCGITLPNIYTSVHVYSVANATAYRYKITNMATNQVEITERTTSWFSFTSLQDYAYGNIYTVETELQINNTWLGYFGQSCVVSLPWLSVGTAPTITKCGVTLDKLYSTVATTSLPGVTAYRYRITNLSQPGSLHEMQVLEREQSFFSLTMLESYNYGQTYAVEVAIKTGLSFSEYGPACTISTPEVTPVIRQCGSTYTNKYASINATTIPYVSAYQFRVTNLSTNQVEIISPAVSYFRMFDLQFFSLATDFSVEVAVKVLGEFGDYGPACIIRSPAAKEASNSIAVNELRVTATPNPFTDAFTLHVSIANTNSDVRVYDMLGKLVESRQIEAQNEFIQLGDRYPSGVYTVLVVQQEQVKVIKMVKR